MTDHFWGSLASLQTGVPTQTLRPVPCPSMSHCHRTRSQARELGSLSSWAHARRTEPPTTCPGRESPWGLAEPSRWCARTSHTGEFVLLLTLLTVMLHLLFIQPSFPGWVWRPKQVHMELSLQDIKYPVETRAWHACFPWGR